MIAAVTDLNGTITGAHRTWLDPSGQDKALVDTPRRAMGHLLGHAVRFGMAHDVMAAGEGIETMLSLRCVMPTMPMVAALSAAHLAAILFPGTLRRLYIARDNDPAGDGAVATLIDGTRQAGIERSRCHPAWATSTTTSTRSASMPCGQRSGCRSSQRTFCASWRWRRPALRRRRCPAAPASSRIRSRGNTLHSSERAAPTAF